MPSSELLRPLTLERVASVETDATVRHIDQLDAETLETFYDALENDRSTMDANVDLEAGEVVVFTEYYRVTHC